MRGIYSNTFSIAWVMGTPSAQAIRLRVHEDWKLSSGVYDIGVTSFLGNKNFCGRKKVAYKWCCRRNWMGYLLEMGVMKDADQFISS
jgi:hypothetical protein